MKIIYSILAISILIGTVSAQNHVELAYKLELNKSYKVKTTSAQNSTQTFQGMQQSVQTSNTLVISLKPLKKIENTTIAEVRFDTIITIVSMPAMNINSTRPGDLKSTDAGQVMECIMNRLSNSTFLVKMENTGRIAEIMNHEQASAAILQGIDSIQGQMAGMLKERAKMMVEKEAIKGMIESVTAYLPGKEVKISDKWESILNLNTSGMDMLSNTTFQLKNVENVTAAINGDIIVKSGPKPMKMNGMDITPNLEGIGKTEMLVDTQTGWIVSGNNKVQMKGELGISGAGMSMQIPFEMNSESEIIALP